MSRFAMSKFATSADRDRAILDALAKSEAYAVSLEKLLAMVEQEWPEVKGENSGLLWQIREALGMKPDPVTGVVNEIGTTLDPRKAKSADEFSQQLAACPDWYLSPADADDAAYVSIRAQGRGRDFIVVPPVPRSIAERILADHRACLSLGPTPLKPNDIDGPLYRVIRAVAASRVMFPGRESFSAPAPFDLKVADLEAVIEAMVKWWDAFHSQDSQKRRFTGPGHLEETGYIDDGPAQRPTE